MSNVAMDRSQSQGAMVWEPRRQSSLEAARRRSAGLSRLRILFVALAAACFSSFFGFMTLHAALGGFRTHDEVAKSEALTMVRPRFSGRTGMGRPFTVSAEAAVRREINSPLIDLTAPVYETEGRRVTATSGVYNQTDRTIKLSGEVVYGDRSNNSFVSSGAVIDGATNSVRGEDSVSGVGPLGSVRADSYEILDGGERFALHGKVRGKLAPKRRE